MVLYQLSYVRIIVCNSLPQSAFPRVPTSKNSIGGSRNLQIETTTADPGSAASLSSSGSCELQPCNSLSLFRGLPLGPGCLLEVSGSSAEDAFGEFGGALGPDF